MPYCLSLQNSRLKNVYNSSGSLLFIMFSVSFFFSNVLRKTFSWCDSVVYVKLAYFLYKVLFYCYSDSSFVMLCNVSIACFKRNILKYTKTFFWTCPAEMGVHLICPCVFSAVKYSAYNSSCKSSVTQIAYSVSPLVVY